MSQRTEVRLNDTTNETYDYPTSWINTTAPGGSFAATALSGGPDTWFTVNTSWTTIDIIQAWHASYYGDVPFYANVLGDGCNSTYSNATWACSGYGGSGAARCSFYPCVRTYSAILEQSKLREQLIGEHEMFVTASYGSSPRWNAADVKCAGEAVMTRLAEAGFQVNNDTTIIPWNVLVDDNGTPSVWAPESDDYSSSVVVPGPLLNTTSLPLDIIPADCIYGLRYWAAESINTYLSTYLNASLSPGPNGASVDGPGQIRALFNDTNASFQSINYTFQGIAEALTVRMRQYRSPDYLPVAQAVQGLVVENETCVHVRWAYLAFPAAIVLFTAVFLAILIVLTSRSTMSTSAARWKSSPLPAIFQGLTISSPFGADYDADSSKVTVIGTQDDRTLRVMEHVSKSTTARLGVDRRRLG